MKKILFIPVIILSLYSCTKVMKPTDPNTDNCQTYQPTTFKNLSQVEIKIRFSSVPSQVDIELPELKYNKQGVFTIEWDDNTRSALTGLEVMKGLSFTDGTGYPRPYTGAVGVNGYTFSGDEIGCSGADILYTEYNQLISQGWDIMNHSNRHVDLNHPTIDIGSYAQDLDALNSLYYQKTGYTPNCFIVPTNYFGFVPEADAMGFLCSSSTGANPYKPKVPAFTQVGDVADLYSGFVQLNRDFKDDWTSGNIQDVKNKINDMITGSDENTHLFYRLGTHGVDKSSLSSVLTYLKAQANDKIWITTAREWMEYRYIKENVTITKSLAGNELTLTISYDNVLSHIRWGDLTLNVISDKDIVSVSQSGEADKVTHTSDVVNVYWDTPYKAQRGL